MNSTSNLQRVDEDALDLTCADYEPVFDETAFNRMVERGALAWADVPDASQWVESLRGGKG